MTGGVRYLNNYQIKIMITRKELQKYEVLLEKCEKEINNRRQHLKTNKVPFPDLICFREVVGAMLEYYSKHPNEVVEE